MISMLMSRRRLRYDETCSHQLAGCLMQSSRRFNSNPVCRSLGFALSQYFVLRLGYDTPCYQAAIYYILEKSSSTYPNTTGGRSGKKSILNKSEYFRTPIY
jgi:hypothetical protein